MTVTEIGQRMSAWEFGCWKVFFREEGITAAAPMQSVAALLAAAYNGPCSPPSGRGAWSASDFLPPEPWKAPAVAPAKRRLKGSTAGAARIAEINAAARRAGMET